jgi:hypothetical protein
MSCGMSCCNRKASRPRMTRKDTGNFDAFAAPSVPYRMFCSTHSWSHHAGTPSSGRKMSSASDKQPPAALHAIKIPFY